MRAHFPAAALVFALALAVPSVARAEEKMTGVVTKLDVAKDKKSAVAVLKDNETAALVPITVVDDVTLQKFERSVISVGDEIKCKYEKKGKKNVAKSFKKAAGCS
jgi:hypothetical protein